MRIAVAALAIVIVAAFSQSCLFGGNDLPTASVNRPSSIPTATPPATLPTPILVGQAQGSVQPVGASGGANTYVVKPGDTIGAIAEQFGVPADQRAAWIADVLRLNGIASASLLQAGVELSLPRVPGATGTARPAAGVTGTPARTGTPGGTPAAGTPTPRPSVQGGGGTYTVVSGDYPGLIAQKHCVTDPNWPSQLLALNNTEANLLQVGQVLQLPAGTPPPTCAPAAQPTSAPAPAQPSSPPAATPTIGPFATFTPSP
jgi:LysM repeat protein